MMSVMSAQFPRPVTLRFLLVLLWFCGLRVGEALGLRRSDLHLVPTATTLGCSTPGPHVHVVGRDNPNRARAKSGDRVVPVRAEVLSCYDRYLAERAACPTAEGCDFVLVNLAHSPLGQLAVSTQTGPGVTELSGPTRDRHAGVRRHRAVS
jgi:integrase